MSTTAKQFLRDTVRADVEAEIEFKKRQMPIHFLGAGPHEAFDHEKVPGATEGEAEGWDFTGDKPKRRGKLAPLMSSERPDWGTPQNLYDTLNETFKFTLDPCTGPDNRLGTHYFFTEADDGLVWPWLGNVFMNPPYGRGIEAWIEKAWYESEEHSATVVCLVPARTDTKWFQIGFAHAKAITFLPGRLKFVIPGVKAAPAPFPSALVTFAPTKVLKIDYANVLRTLGPTWEYFTCRAL